MLILLTLFAGFKFPHTIAPSVWIVDTNHSDLSTNLAVSVLQKNIADLEATVRVIGLEGMSKITSEGDVFVIVGHGETLGLCIDDCVVPWQNLYESLEAYNPARTIVLACNSPSDTGRAIYGFTGMIDAEAGAILSPFLVMEFLGCEITNEVSFSRITECQRAMLHPLGRVLYFVHGYFGSNSDFADMMQAFAAESEISAGFTAFHSFSYYSAFGISDTDTTAINNLHYASSIDDYAEDLYDALSQYPSGTQINFVAHSMGGIIVRRMLMNYRTQLENSEVDIGCVVTMGTPNLGTWLANPLNSWATILTLLGGYLGSNGALWPSPVFWSLCPLAPFIIDLNYDPNSYSDNIRWYTGAGIDSALGLALLPIHGEYSDPLVGESKAYLSFATTRQFYDIDHNTLIRDETNQETYDDIATWLTSVPDTDGEGLDDDVEVYIYGTDPNDWDSDNDGLSDADEVLYFGTNPLAWSTDGDILSDANEIAWGYDPFDANNPISASSLIYNAWQYNGVTGYVRANHYSAMDYVKVYVKYKTSAGYWTSYFYVGSDSTPYTSGDYYVSWSLLQGYVQMEVKVNAYDSQDHYLGCDTAYVTLPGGGGGGGGDPLPE